MEAGYLKGSVGDGILSRGCWGFARLGDTTTGMPTGISTAWGSVALGLGPRAEIEM